MNGAKLHEANVQGVNVEDSILTGADLKGIRNLSMAIEDVKKEADLFKITMKSKFESRN